MNLTSRLLQRTLKLSRPQTRNLVVQRDLPVLMPDGVELLADRCAPRDGGETLPTALIRSPYRGDLSTESRDEMYPRRNRSGTVRA